MAKWLDHISDAEQTLEMLLESIPSGVLATDETGRISMASARAQELLGFRLLDIAGLEIGPLLALPPGATTDRTTWGLEVMTRAANGVTLPLTVYRSPIGGTGALWILQDRTETAFLETAFMESEYREQRRLAQLLHDQLSQQLLGASFSAKLLANQLDKQAPALAEEAHDVARMVNASGGQLREITADPATRAAAEGDLPGALRALAAQTKRAELEITCQDESSIDLGRTTTLVYRMVLEAVTCAIAAGAEKITVLCWSESEYLQIKIVSNESTPNVLTTTETNEVARRLFEYRCKFARVRAQLNATAEFGSTITLSIPVQQ